MILERCSWCLGDEINLNYHDNEWGNPNFDENSLFEFLILETSVDNEAIIKALCEIDLSPGKSICPRLFIFFIQLTNLKLKTQAQ